jgi:hypothetical protein
MAENNFIASYDRWEREGGPDLPGRTTRLTAGALAETERRILIALGAAVVAEWNTLGSDVQREVFRPAAGEAPKTAQLREQIGRFLHDHKDANAVA